MAVTFILGRSGSGKTTNVQNEIVRKMQEDPMGPPIIYIVPDQMTFQVERKLVEKLGHGMTRTQVLSFSRLALRVLQEVGGISRYHIQQTGIQMLLRQVVERAKPDFTIFQKALSSPGFINQLEQMLSEFKRYQIDSDTLREEMNKLAESEEQDSPTERTLKDKLHDIHIILSEVEKSLSEKYIASEDYLQLLADSLKDSLVLQDAVVYIDGFHSFTPIEINVLHEIFLKIEEVTIVLTVDEAVKQDELIHPLDLFFETQSTYQQLQNLCDDCKISHQYISNYSKRFVSPALAYLEANGAKRPADPILEHDGIQVISAVHRRAEIERIAREIISLVRDDNYRYGEIAILVRNMGEYDDYFETIFHDEGIPFFSDQKRSVLNHPLIEFIRSTLEIIERHWQYDAVFRALKTEMLFPIEDEHMREKVDQLENYVLSYGIKGKKWYGSEEWTYQRFATTTDYEGDKTDNEKIFEEEINLVRKQLLSPIIDFQKAAKNSSTVFDYAKALFELLEEIKVTDKIEQLSKDAMENHRLREAREHDQMWKEIIDLLDQMVEISGNEKVSFKLFMQMVDTGIESMKFAIIPPAIDQVVIANMETSRISDVRAAFIIGMNDGVIPAKPNEDSMVSEEERTFLEKQGLQLAPGAQRQLLNESFVLYMSQSLASEKLYMSYPLADEEGKSLQPSMMLNQIQEVFPELKVEVALEGPADVQTDKEVDFVTNPERTLSHLTNQMQAWRRGYHVSEIWWDTYNWFMSQEQWQEKTKNVFGSLSYKNKPSSLPLSLSEELYGTELKTSVSRLEQYNACPFSQFANYGLKLRERETFKLEAPDIGTLFHAALKEMAESLRQDGRDFSHLSRDEAKSLSKTIVEQLAPKIQREILLSSNRFKYIQQKLEEVVARASTVLSDQAKLTGFSPAGLEVGFGPNQQLPPLTFEIENGHKVELIGRIDRVDRAEDEEGVYVRILDYKSSSKDIKLDDVYHGLALQMLIYLDVVVSFAAEWLGTEVTPAGVLYFHVHNPMIQAEEKLSIEDIEEEILKRFKMKGLISSSLSAIKQMDLSLETGRSSMLPVGLKKDGQPYSNSKVISQTDYDVLRSYLRNHVKKVGESILRGDIDLKPYKKKQKIPCTFCSYKSFCQFDPTIETNNYRHLTDQSNDEILESIRDKGGNVNEYRTETE
ncbi:helicase-exonuclease AddAB subunit AddB [Salipaludibacillus neizhouensis]|uniref:ATP-dependent helicase/deoxyribonuclease subunit B n=1 Tax=Salipaludibacillus neizhouensis TaxID=885475 RepID=A0A3A9KB19_9BACI|nr:helicase-exonuclease AddAB subunit AddB [Salipaludibacillus neizhouensis]RKL69349.1 helicase-exonuclease AddAB subunit AddB [Salipaludibacillus neizhouensis]